MKHNQVFDKNFTKMNVFRKSIIDSFALFSGFYPVLIDKLLPQDTGNGATCMGPIFHLKTLTKPSGLLTHVLR